jgi:hypothetical protein
LTLSYEDVVDLTTHVGSDYGDIELNIGGSFYMQDGSFTFDHEHNRAGDVDFENSISVYLPFDLLVGPGGIELGNVTFEDSDFYDGELSPGFNFDLQDVSGIFDAAVYLVLDWLGSEIEGLRGDLVPVYAADGSVISEGYEALTRTIPGTDISINGILGLENLLNVGKYIRHYLRPQLGDTGFTRDPNIPLGDPAAAGESGTSYYGPGGPTLGGFFQYLEANWIPTLGGQAGGFTWETVTDGSDIVGIDLVFEQDFTFDRQFSLNFGEEVEAIGLEIDGQVLIDLTVAIDLAMGLSFNWGTDPGTGDDTIDFDIDRLNFSGHAAAEDIVIGASIGPLSVSLGDKTYEKGRLALDLGAETSYIDGVVSFTPTANTASDHNNYIDAYLPVYAAIGDVNFSSGTDPPQLSLSGTLFPSAGGPELSFSHENMEQLLDFSGFNIGSLIAIIQSTLNWLNDLTDYDFMTYELPIINMPVGQLFDFASSFADKVQSRIDFERINSVQDFIEQFTAAGILPPGLDVVYDTATSSLTLPVNFDFNFNDLDLRNLANLGEFDFQQLLDMGAIDPAELFDKDNILSGLLDMFATPLDQLARWELIDIDSFNPAISLLISELESLELIEAGALGTGSILLTDLLDSDAVNVNLQDLFNFDLLTDTDFASGGVIDFDELIASRLMSQSDLIEAGLTLFGLDTDANLNITDLEIQGVIDPGALDSLGLTQISLGDLLDSDLVNVDVDDLVAADLISGVLQAVDEVSDAAFVNLTDLLSLRQHSLTDAIDMGFVSEDEFDLLTSLDLQDIADAGIDVAALGTGTILLGDLLNSTDVSVTLLDLIGAGLVGSSDLGSFDFTTLLTIADLESHGIITAGALDSLGLTDISLGNLLASDLVDVDVMDLVAESLLDAGDVIAGLGDVLGSDLMFEGFNLYDLVDMGMLAHSDIVGTEYDLLNIQDRPIDLGFDLGDVFEMGFNTTATVLVSVQAGFEWVIDFDGPTGEEGITFLINNAQVSGRAELELEELGLDARLGFVELSAGGDDRSGLNLLAEAVITLDEDGDIATDNDRSFSFTDLVSGGLVDHFLFDFTGYGRAGLVGIDISPDIPGLNESGFNDMELSITIPDLLNWDVVEVITQGEATEEQINAHLEQDHVVVVIPDVEDLINLSEFDFASIIQAIRTGLEFIETALEGTSFYRQTIPVINRSVAESFQFLYDFLDKIELAAEDPAAVLQQVEALIEDALGLSDPDAFGLSLDTTVPGRTVVKIHIEWIKLLSDYLDEEHLSFAFDLGSIIGIFGGSIGSGWDFINELISGGADIAWDAQVEMVVDLGIDVTEITSGDIDFFLYDYNSGTDEGTHISLGVKVEATDLELMFEPLGIGVTGGSAHLGTLTYDGSQDYYYTDGARVTSADFAEFTLAVDQQTGGDDDGRFYFATEDFGDNWTYDLTGGFDIYLPLEIPLVTVTPLHVYTNNAPTGAVDPGWGDEALLEAFRRLGGHTPETGEPEAVIVELPDITVMDDFGLLNILNDPTFILDGLDLILGTLQEVTGSSFAQDIPLIGDKLYKAATFLRDIRTGFLADLREKLSGPGAAIKYIRDSMWEVFGPGGLDIVLDADGNGRIEIADIGVDWYDVDGNHLKQWKEGDRVPMSGYIYDPDGNFVSTSGTPTGGQFQISADTDAIQFDVPLGGIAFGTGIDIPLDIDVPAFALNVDGGFAVEMKWSYDLLFGLSVTDYIYMGTNDKTSPNDPELEVEIGAFLDGEPLNNATVTPFYAEGKLLFFILSVEDIDREEGIPDFQPSGVFGFLELDVMGDPETGRVTFNRLVSAPIRDVFDINFGVEATLNLTMTLDVGDVGLPRLKADFIARWSWDLDNGAGDPEFGLYNLRIDVGTFITDILKPITDRISDILDPFEPIVDVFTTEISGLDVICDPPNLLGLINLILSTLGYNEIPVEFFNAVKTMIDVVDQVDAMIGIEGEILLGDILNLGTDNVEARQAQSSLPSQLQSFLDNLSVESTGAGSGSTGVQGGGTATERGGFEIIDYILDIGNWMKLITGGDAILFTYEMPLLEYELTFRQGIATITAGPAVINVYAVGGFSITADLGFGMDTYGIRKAIDTGNWWYVFDGFYVADWGITSGVEKDEFIVGLEIGLEAALWLLLVEAGLGGVVGFEMGLDLQDIDNDGRIHPSEFVTMWNYTGYDAPGGLRVR